MVRICTKFQTGNLKNTKCIHTYLSKVFFFSVLLKKFPTNLLEPASEASQFLCILKLELALEFFKVFAWSD